MKGSRVEEGDAKVSQTGVAENVLYVSSGGGMGYKYPNSNNIKCKETMVSFGSLTIHFNHSFCFGRSLKSFFYKLGRQLE